MQKVLFVANHEGFHKFNAPFMRWFQENGWRVEEASPGADAKDCSVHYQVDIGRSPFSRGNLGAYFHLKRIVRAGGYDIVHCHTPMGGVLARLAAGPLRKKGVRVIYTAHGFHFFRGASLLAWLLFFPVEYLLAFQTDCLVTINHEDYAFSSRRLRPKSLYRIDGVGVDLSRFRVATDEDRATARSAFGYAASDFVLVYVAQFIERKNHTQLFQTFDRLAVRFPELRLLLIGDGPLLEPFRLQAVTKGHSDRVSFLGFRTDVDKLLQLGDVHVSTSRQEGLAIGNIEALASGLPVVCSKIRGHIETVEDGRNGFLFDLEKAHSLDLAIEKLYLERELLPSRRSQYAASAKKFSSQIAVRAMADIYRTQMGSAGEREEVKK